MTRLMNGYSEVKVKTSQVKVAWHGVELVINTAAKIVEGDGRKLEEREARPE